MYRTASSSSNVQSSEKIPTPKYLFKNIKEPWNWHQQRKRDISRYSQESAFIEIPVVDITGKKRCISVPQNIRHKVGSKVCDSLLSNESKIQESVMRINGDLELYCRPLKVTRQTQKDDQSENTDAHQNDWTTQQSDRGVQLCHGISKRQPQNDRQKENQNTTRNLDKPSLDNPTYIHVSDYDSIGLILRQNVFPGPSVQNPQSITKSSHTEEVHLRRVPETDEFKYKRHNLSTWTEQQIFHVLLDKQWEHYFENIPKAYITWDRNAKRTVPKIEPLLKPKAKPVKTKPKAQEKSQKPSEPEEEIVFETPPLTPLPEPSLAPMPKKLERDDEFWKFYDQEPPK